MDADEMHEKRIILAPVESLKSPGSICVGLRPSAEKTSTCQFSQISAIPPNGPAAFPNFPAFDLRPSVDRGAR
jgi:hypothetical protein